VCASHPIHYQADLFAVEEFFFNRFPFLESLSWRLLGLRPGDSRQAEGGKGNNRGRSGNS